MFEADTHDDTMKFRILVVDDEPAQLDALYNTLMRTEYFECDVKTANSAEEAWLILKHHKFDLVLSDHMMPGMTGIELLSKIKNKYPATARVLITAYSDIDLAKRAINSADVDSYIEKPWNNDELRMLVFKSLKNNQIRETGLKFERSKEVVQALHYLKMVQKDLSNQLGLPILEKTVHIELHTEKSYQCLFEEVQRLDGFTMDDLREENGTYFVAITVFPQIGD